MARPTKLTRAVHNRIVKAVREGLPYEVAAKAARIDISTFYRWRNRGKEDKEAGVDSVFCEFCDALEEAVAKGESQNAAIIARAARGGSKATSTKVVKKQEGGEDGELKTVLIEETVTIKKTLPDWRAAMAGLERRHPERWGRNVKVDANVRSVSFSADEAAQAEKELAIWMSENFGDESQE